MTADKTMRKSIAGPSARAEENLQPKHWAVRNRVPLALLGAWTCLAALLFALDFADRAAGFVALWVMGFSCAIVALVLWEAQMRERQRSEEALRQSERLFKLIAETIDEVFWMNDAELQKVLYISPAYERVWGRPRSEAYAHPKAFLDAVHPDDKEKTFAMLAGLQTGLPFELEFRIVRPDGTVASIRDQAFPVRNESGELECYVGIAQDITERKLVEAQVRRSNEELSASVWKLEMKGIQETILSEMRTFLQACTSTLEMGPVIAHSLRMLLPGSEGTLFLLSPSKTDLEAAVSWRDGPEQPDENAFPPDACWALRTGRLHLVDDLKSGLLCLHLGHSAATAHACMPLTANSEVLGLLHIQSRPAAGPVEAREMIAVLEGISSMLSELLSLSISNLRLGETLRTQAIRDPLTGLFNRRYMEETLQREIHRATRNQKQVSIVMADIDHFKAFNDLHGHAAGDVVLTGLAAFLRSQMRVFDIPCRYGGEEFTLVFIESSLEDTIIRCNELREQLKELKFRYAGQEVGPVSLSLGVSVYPANGPKVEDLLRAADAALYQAKQTGRDRVVPAGCERT